MSESAHSTDQVQTAASNAAADRERAMRAADTFDAAEDVLRLLIGVALVGADEFLYRLQRWEATAQSSSSVATKHSAATPLEYASASQSIRYAVIGMLFESQTRVRRRFSSIASTLVDLANAAEYAFAMRLAPSVRNTPLDQLIHLFDEATFVTLSTLDRWTARGWVEEQRGRRIARLGASSTVDELFGYIARNPELRKLIEQQGTSLAEDAVDHVREQTTSADAWIERLAHSLLHRPMSDAPEQSAAQLDSRMSQVRGG